MISDSTDQRSRAARAALSARSAGSDAPRAGQQIVQLPLLDRVERRKEIVLEAARRVGAENGLALPASEPNACRDDQNDQPDEHEEGEKTCQAELGNHRLRPDACAATAGAECHEQQPARDQQDEHDPEPGPPR